MKEEFWYKECPFCNQGRLFVFKNLDKNVLYLHCEECERGYYDFKNVEKSNAFLTLSEDFDTLEATEKDIVNFGLNIEDFHRVLI